MRKFKVYLMVAAVAGVSLFSACKDDDPKPIDEIENPDVNNAEIEALATNAKWNNYLVAATSELYTDCTELWAAWNGPNGVEGDELARIGGAGFFSSHSGDIGANGYGEILKTAGQQGNTKLTSQINAIKQILEDGCVNIAGEVGQQKIGGPYNHAKAGDKRSAVLEVESWYSWNSIKDYSDNIVSIKNTYFGNRESNSASANSISAFIKSKDADLDQEVIIAINRTYTAISGMQAPFRNNLTGTKVEEAMNACADLVELMETKVYPLLEGSTYNFTATLAEYTDNVVIPTYRDMKNAAKVMYNAAAAYQANPTQANMDAICTAWKANRIPWEQSEAFLFGPADVLGLDPLMDSWPLDQVDILGILTNPNVSTVKQITDAINSETVRGFHTIELLLFKDGQNRTVVTNK